MSRVRLAVALACSLVGGWLTVPCALLVLFEAQGFGNDRDVGTRTVALVGYVALGIYVVGVVTGVITLGIFA